MIDLEQLREAERCYTPPARFGKVLVERGFLTPRELWNGVKYQVEEIVRSLLLYTAGRLYFFEGDLQPDNVVRLALPTRRLVAEGLQRSDELQKFLRVLDGERVELVATAGARAAGRARASAPSSTGSARSAASARSASASASSPRPRRARCSSCASWGR